MSPTVLVLLNVLILAGVAALLVGGWRARRTGMVAAARAPAVEDRGHGDDEALRRRQAEYLRTVIDTAPDVIFAQDAEGRIRMANRATAEVLGMPLDAVVGRLHREVSARVDDVRRLEEQIAEVLGAGEGRTVERPVSHPVTGETVWYETRVVPLQPPEGGPPHALVVGTDLTPRRTAEEELRRAQRDILTRLAQAAEFRDDATGQHTRRVGRLSAELAALLGFDAPMVELIGAAAPLHDIGKIAIPDAILLKPGALSPEEYQVMKTHTLVGGTLLAGDYSEMMSLAEEIALNHHERWDGSGYPNGRRADETPVAARIVWVADVVDALSYDRPDRSDWPVSRVVAELLGNRGRLYDPRCVDACMEILDRPVEAQAWRVA